MASGRLGSGGVPLCGCQRFLRAGWAVERPIAEHGEQDVAAATSKRDEGLIVAFSLADLAHVVGPGYGVTQGCKGRQEHRAFELFVSRLEGSSPRMDEPERRVTGANPA